jgi:replication-associated recombination protein RarA
MSAVSGFADHESDEARIHDPQLQGDEEFDSSLRPRRLEDFVGQASVKDQLAVSITAACAREEALDHVLLAGPPGLGKTSLAQIVAAELDVQFVQTAGPALERKADIAALLTALEPRAVFFIDEIHRLPRALEETFYPAMEDRALPITVGQGAGARVITLDLPPFTLIGATTRAGLLTTPLRDRFGIQHRLEHYDKEELAKIVRRSARRRSRSAAAARHGSPTGCSSASVTTSRSAAAAWSPPLRRPRRSISCRSITRAWTAWIGRFCGRFAKNSAADPSVFRRWRSPSARSRTRSRTSTSRTCSSAV